MSDIDDPDYYEMLQVSPSADSDTIERVYRHLAKRYHPDNADSGDAQRFNDITDAFRTLSDPEKRARYDAGYEDSRRERWKVFNQMASTRNVEADRRIRLGLLTLLYQARRRDVDKPGMGIIELERVLDCPEEHMKFHLWYLKEHSWIERRDNGSFAITVEGIDELDRQDIPWAEKIHRLPGPRSDEGDPDAPPVSESPRSPEPTR